MLHIYEEAARCLLCKDAPCTKACSNGDPARAIRAIRFYNTKNVWRWIKDCSDADLERADLMPTWNVPSRLASTTTSPYASGSC